MTNTVLILGARGRFGLATARAFAAAGWQVRGLLRPGTPVPTGLAGLEEGPRMQWLHADLQDGAAVARAAQGTAVVVHALNPAYTNKAWQAQALPMTDAAIAISRALGATLMFMGNVYNFGSSMPAVLAQDTPQRADTEKGHIRVAMERRIRQSGVRAIVVRAGDFFGSGRGSWFDQAMAKDLDKGRLVYPGHKNVATAWAYLPDLARTFVEVAAQRQRLNAFAVLHFAGHRLSGQDWLDTLQPLARAQGWVPADAALRYRRLPWPVIRLGALFMPTWAALVEMRYLWDTPHALDNRALVALLGAEPHTPLPQAVHQALTELGGLRPQPLTA